MTRLGTSRTPSLSELLQAAVSQAIGDMFVALPGKIVTYDPITQTADVQPLLKRPVVFDDGTIEPDDLPIVPSVPIAFPRGGGFFLSFPMAKGDLVLLVFCDRSIDKYKTSGGTAPTDPIDVRTNDISDAVAYPGFYPMLRALKDGAANSSVMAFGKETGMQIHIDETGIRLGGMAATEPAMQGTKFIAKYNSHTHTTAFGPSGVPVILWLPADNSLKVKVE